MDGKADCSRGDLFEAAMLVGTIDEVERRATRGKGAGCPVCTSYCTATHVQ